jgi:hypothetical protein
MCFNCLKNSLGEEGARFRYNGMFYFDAPEFRLTHERGSGLGGGAKGFE